MSAFSSSAALSSATTPPYDQPPMMQGPSTGLVPKRRIVLSTEPWAESEPWRSTPRMSATAASAASVMESNPNGVPPAVHAVMQRVQVSG